MYNHIYIAIGLVFFVQVGATAQDQTERPPVEVNAKKLTAEELQRIEKIVDELVFADGDATNEPTLSPGIRDKSPEYEQRYKKVQEAFNKLSDLKEKAFPVLVKHLDDKRQSINFRNHYLGNSVGDACKWSIYYQLQDRPGNYSSYGYQRKGRDGKNHPKPYWEGSPFDNAGGVAKWLEQNKELSYPEMQIKCLNWLLAHEKKIGASDSDSYFENILPLEIQILKRESEIGKDVRKTLAAKEKALQDRDASTIPDGMLPKK